MKKNIFKHIAEVAILIIILCFCLSGLAKLVEDKGSTIKYNSFFSSKDDYDVLFFGTSHVINGVFPMELWNDDGITSYNMAGHANTIATTYWMLKNSLDYASPKLAVIDCYGLSKDEKIGDNYNFIHTSFDEFPLSRTKVAAIDDLMSTYASDDRFSLLWDYSAYHSRWNDIGMEDFTPYYSCDDGAEPRIDWASPDKNKKIASAEKCTDNTVSAVYLRKAIEECQGRGIDVLLTYLPFPATKEQQMEANRVYDIAKEYNVNYIDFLDTDVVNYDTDCWDNNSHLNISGARKVTDYLGNYIRQHYDLPDQRQNENYKSWNEDYQKYYDNMISEMKSEKHLYPYLLLAANKNYDVVIKADSKSVVWKNDLLVKLFENIGVDPRKITGSTDIIISEKAGEDVSYIDSFINSGTEKQTSVGDLTCWFTGSDLTSEYGVYLDSNEVYTSDSENDKKHDIRIVLLDASTKRVLDNVAFDCDITEEQDPEQKGLKFVSDRD